MTHFGCAVCDPSTAAVILAGATLDFFAALAEALA